MTQKGRLGNGLTSVYEYYDWTLDTNQPGYQQGGRLSTLVTGAFQNLSYTYDPGGNITRIVDAVPEPDETLEYTYDLIDRLVGDTTNGGNGYTYDGEGNLWHKGTSTLDYADPANHQVTQMGSNTYGYDDNGNMTARAGATLSYDAENRLVGYSSGGVSAVFLYDGDGRRVKGTVNGVTTLYVNDYYEIEGTTVRKYYSAGGQRIAVRENGGVSYLLADHLGSITVSLDGQNLTGTRSYSSWGETRGSAGTLPTGRGYQGQYAEGELGLLFFNARWVDPQLGRFVSADSLVPELGNPGDWDRYAFVRNNPINGTDPTGHWPSFDLNINSDWFCSATQMALDVSGLSKVGVTTNTVANAASTAATIADIMIGAIDASATGAVIGGTIALSPELTPPVAYALCESAAKPVMNYANLLATGATISSTYSDILKGETKFNLQIKSDGKNFDVMTNGTLSSSGTKSWALTTVGWGMPLTWTSLLGQTATIMNDFGVFSKWDSTISWDYDYSSPKKIENGKEPNNSQQAIPR